MNYRRWNSANSTRLNAVFGTLLAWGVTGVMIASGMLVIGSQLIGSAATPTPKPPAHSTPVPASPSEQLAAAQASLSSYGTPAWPGSGSSSAVNSPASGPNWTQVTNPVPGTRYGGAMAFDAQLGVYILFGGANQTGSGTVYLGDTWELTQSGVWIPLSPAKSPPARAGAAVAYDSVDKYLVLFGGTNGVSTFGDTWKFSSGTWAKITGSVHPPGLQWASMSFDTHDGNSILFGGFNSGNVAQNATWKFIGGKWTALTPAHAPSPRAQTSMTYDALDQYVVLFGGLSINTIIGGVTVYGDTWEFAGGTWTQLHPSPAPPGRAAAPMGYSAADSKVILFGGLNHLASGLLSDTWKFSGGNWTKFGSLVHPSARQAAMVGDAPNTGGVGTVRWTDF